MSWYPDEDLYRAWWLESISDGLDYMTYEEIRDMLILHGYNELEVLDLLNNGGYGPGSEITLDDFLSIMEASEALDHVGAALRHAFRNAGIGGDEGYATPEEIVEIGAHLDIFPSFTFDVEAALNIMEVMEKDYLGRVNIDDFCVQYSIWARDH
ncbi:unnamed protein product [Owenia fusiformis]|uniref:Uncharacterized protein n=1 Tax=Owenia fusiformis TaxID=6347 RepID=A0A8S4MWU1_OWEFU|nr:unnamed protein product [Owenia fusiformis]